MADAPKILGTDTLRQAYPKINAAIDNANEALNKATTAETNSTNAVNTANSVQSQLNQIVIEGDSSVEAAQARVDAEGNVYTTLKERIDAEQIKIGILSDIVGVNILDFPTIQGEIDDTGRIQRALNYAKNNGFTHVFLEGKKYTISQTITIPQGIKLIGAPSYSKTWNSDLNLVTGTVILCKTTSNVFILNTDSKIENLIFFYPDQDFNTWTDSGVQYPGTTYHIYNPIVCAPTIDIVEGASDFSVKNCFFVNSYHVIDLTKTHARHELINIRFTPIRYGITIGNCVDWGKMENIKAHPYWSEAYGHSGNAFRVNLYAEMNAVSFEIGASDGEKVYDIASVGANIGLLFSTRGGSGCQGAMITQYSHDLGWKGIQIDAGTQIVLENIYLAPMNPQVSRKEPITNGSCFGIQVNTGGFVTIDNVNMLRCDGIGIHITIGAYGFWGSNINIFQTAYKGVFIDNPQGNYVYRIKLENVNVDCLYSTTIPYDFDMLAMSSVKNLTWSGVEPTTKISNTGYTDTCTFDYSTLWKAEKRITSGITQQFIVPAKVNVTSEGAVTVTSLTNGIDFNVVAGGDSYLFYVNPSGAKRTVKAIISSFSVNAGVVSPYVVVAAVNTPNAIRFYDTVNNVAVPVTDNGLKNKSYFVVIVLE